MVINSMIIGAFIVLMLVGSAMIKADESSEERRRNRKTKDIWYRV